MPRRARIDAPGALHHIIVRGIERRRIFKDDIDRINFLNRLGAVLSETSTGCFAWGLIDNHFHLLLRTGLYPIATVMRRLLTGYAIAFNHRHRRSGHLFYNRYKSILCEEEAYLLELVRYIHLNPIRAGLVANMKVLNTYPFSGHAVIMGERKKEWQDVAHVLRLFSDKRSTARRRYRLFVQEGIQDGRRPELTGGGLIRSIGGWSALKSLRRAKVHVKSDERILGESHFVEKVLRSANEALEHTYQLRYQGYDVNAVADGVAEIFCIDPEEIFKPGKQPAKVKARSLFCYWAVRELGLSMTELSQKVKISQPAVSICVRRGEGIARENGYSLTDQ